MPCMLHLERSFNFLLTSCRDASLTNYLLLISLAFLVLGFAAINRFGMLLMLRRFDLNA
jgi:hypothetical protein